ncbi:MAG: addiction module antitoxin [Candidatus Paceibacteria bacterium]
MNTVTKKQKVTLMLDVEVYKGLVEKLGKRGMGAYLSKLARPHVVADNDEIAAGYKAMAADKAYETEANEWIEGTLYEIDEENVWQF